MYVGYLALYKAQYHLGGRESYNRALVQTESSIAISEIVHPQH